MTDTAYHFRTALSGFHKGDVAGYIEKTAAAHRSEILEYEKVIADLREKNQSLQQQLNLMMMTTAALEDKAAKAEAAAAAPEPAPEPAPESVPAPQPAVDPVAAVAEINMMELQAYRRAEAAERNANARAKKLCQQLDQMREDAMVEFEITDNVVKETLEAIRTQTAAMERAYGSLSDTLDISREKLGNMVVLEEKAEEAEAENAE